MATVTTQHAYALIGRSFPSEAYESLYRASLAARADRRALGRADQGHRATGASRRWRGSGEPVTLPPRLTR